MDTTTRGALASRLLEGYVHGPAAATEATARALAKVPGAKAVVLVEGISDQIAVETFAPRRGWDLGAERVVVVPVGGAHAMTRYLRQFGPSGAGLRLAGLCDAGEENVVRRALASAGIGSPGTRAGLERLGFYVCVEDLEDELIRAIGAARVEELVDSQGDLGSFRSLQRQPGWRGQPTGAQLRRFLAAAPGAKAGTQACSPGRWTWTGCRIRSKRCSPGHNPPCNEALRRNKHPRLLRCVTALRLAMRTAPRTYPRFRTPKSGRTEHRTVRK
jgi:hypothetical protein